MAPEELLLSSSLREAMIAHARAGLPCEACGIVAGEAGRPVHFYPATNAAHSPVRYNLDPHDLLRITLDLDAHGWTLWGIFHSHPATEAYPSHTDLRLAFYPEAVYLILSLADPQAPNLRAFRIRDLRISELAVKVEP